MGPNSRSRFGSLFAWLAFVALPSASAAWADGVPARGLSIHQDSWLGSTAGRAANGSLVLHNLELHNDVPDNDVPDNNVTVRRDADIGSSARPEYRVTMVPSRVSVLGVSLDSTSASRTTLIDARTGAFALGAMPGDFLLRASISASISASMRVSIRVPITHSATDSDLNGFASLTSFRGNPLSWSGLDFGSPSQLPLNALLNAPCNICAPFAGPAAPIGPQSLDLPRQSELGFVLGASDHVAALPFSLVADDRSKSIGTVALGVIPGLAATTKFSFYRPSDPSQSTPKLVFHVQVHGTCRTVDFTAWHLPCTLF